MADQKQKPAPVPDWMIDMARAEPPGFMAGVINDHYRNPIGHNASLLPPDRQQSSENEAAEIPVRPPSGVALCDRMIDEQDFLDRAARLKTMLEAVLIARQSSKG